ncbi:MAG: two-component system, LuxR family, sensor kinase FixL [Verrucomicrobiota bacterium]
MPSQNKRISKPRGQRRRKFMASDGQSARDLIGAAMKKMKRRPGALGKFSANEAHQKNGASNISTRTLRPPQTALEQAIQRYVDLFDFAPIGYVTFDRIGRIEEINYAAAQLLGRPRRRLIGSQFALCIAKSDVQLFLHHILHCRSYETRVETALHLNRPDGKKLYVQLSSTPAHSLTKGDAELFQSAIVDLTERARAEKELRESEERHRAIVSQSTVGMARSNLQGRFVFVNRKFCEMLGYQESELLGKRILDITHPDYVAQSRALFRRIVDKGAPYELEKRYVRKDGTPLWVSVSASPVRDAAGQTESTVAIILDITEQKKARAALEEAKILLEERARGLEGEILEISDREQRRLGQDLHDSLCQHLTAVAFMARSVAMRLKNHRVLEVADIDKIAELINEGVTEARSIARGLHPVEMDPAGLAAAVQSLLNRQSKLPYRLDMDEDFKISDPTVALHLYRIAREAVINANKHSRARELVVRMRRSDRQIELSVTDDGIGLPPKSKDGTGMGFHIMDYRARTIGARLEIKTVKPHGTCVACYLSRK